MPRRFQLCGLLFGASLSIFCLTAQAQVPKDFHPNVAVLQSPHAQGVLSEGRVRDALWYVASDMKVALENIPRIVVVHAGPGEAGVAELPMTGASTDGKTSGVVLISPTENGEKLFYLWVIGKPSDEILVRGIVQILHAPIPLGDAESAAVARRILVRMRAVVRADELHSG